MEIEYLLWFMFFQNNSNNPEANEAIEYLISNLQLPNSFVIVIAIALVLFGIKKIVETIKDEKENKEK